MKYAFSSGKVHFSTLYFFLFCFYRNEIKFLCRSKMRLHFSCVSFCGAHFYFQEVDSTSFWRDFFINFRKEQSQ